MNQYDGQLLHAAAFGDINGARKALELGANINAIDGSEAALHRAAVDGNFEMCRLLIGAGADVSLMPRGNISRTPLHSAFGRLRPLPVDVIRLLLEHGADANQHDAQRGMRPLHLAVLHGREEAPGLVRMLVGFGACPNAMTDSGMVPLHAAAGNAPWSIEAVRALVACGADPAFLPPDASIGTATPFHAAVRLGYGELVEYYVREGGQSLDQTTVDGRTLMDLVKDRPQSLAALLSVQATQSVTGALAGGEDSSKAPGRQRQQMSL